MRLFTAVAAGALALAATSASAAPVGKTIAPETESIVETVQAWRYRRDCIWVNGGWHYGRPGRYVVCRPYRPIGPGWVWYSEGPRHGWYHPGRRAWYYNKW